MTHEEYYEYLEEAWQQFKQADVVGISLTGMKHYRLLRELRDEYAEDANDPFEERK